MLLPFSLPGYVQYLVKFLNSTTLCLGFTHNIYFFQSRPTVRKFAGTMVVLSICMREENEENARLCRAQRRNSFCLAWKSNILLPFSAQTVQAQNKSIMLYEPSKEIVTFMDRDIKLKCGELLRKPYITRHDGRCNVFDQLSPFLFLWCLNMRWRWIAHMLNWMSDATWWKYCFIEILSHSLEWGGWGAEKRIKS